MYAGEKKIKEKIYGQDLSEVCRDVLAEKKATLWGRAFEITDRDGGDLDEAAEWLASQVAEVVTEALRRHDERLGTWRVRK